MPNRTNCETCAHKQQPDGGHCYMFQTEPTFDCLIHTGFDSLMSARSLGNLTHLLEIASLEVVNAETNESGNSRPST